MKKMTFLPVAVLFCMSAFSQNMLQAFVQDSLSGEPLPGATISIPGTSAGTGANLDGYLEFELPSNFPITVLVRFVGYQSIERTLTEMPSEVIFFRLKPKDLEEIIVEGTRSNKSIANLATRVEVLTEEIEEASTMDPSKIAHLLTHTTGVQVQQTSATSNTANVRIQGLDGRYTQILKDGFPLYGGFSGSLSIMQIPPLDLRQIEFIKGGASTLYGGGAIAGLINLISKEPDEQETLLHLNYSHIGAFDVNAFVSRRTEKIGFTLLGQRNAHRYFDADKDGFTDLPQLTKYNLNPRLFFYFSKKTKLTIGATLADETRKGGDVQLIKNQRADSTHFYRETNDSRRITTQIKFDHHLNDENSFSLRNSINYFSRQLSVIPSAALDEYRFGGNQFSTFSEFSHRWDKGKHQLVSGLNFYSDQFREDSLDNPLLREETFFTTGIFTNYNVDFGKKASVEAGFRGDYVHQQRFYALPRLAILYKWNSKLSSRIGAGMGYRNPTLFNQEAELLAFQNVLPLDLNTLRGEQSYGGNADLSFKTPLGEHFFLHINQMMFYTHLSQPLVLVQEILPANVWRFVNADGYTQSIGTETFFKLSFYDFVFFAGYTFTYATNHWESKKTEMPLTPRHSLKGDLLYSIPGKWRIGVDYEFKSSQKLSDGRTTRSFATFGALVEYTWKHYTIFGNLENFTNIRQTRFESLISGPNSTPQFTEVWAPLDGFLFNGGVKIRL